MENKTGMLSKVEGCFGSIGRLRNIEWLGSV